jgi:hypothetical protein
MFYYYHNILVIQWIGLHHGEGQPPAEIGKFAYVWHNVALTKLIGFRGHFSSILNHCEWQQDLVER